MSRPRHAGPGSTFASRCPAAAEGHLGPMFLPHAASHCQKIKYQRPKIAMLSDALPSQSGANLAA